VSRSSRYLAFLSYLLSLPGALFVLLARRDDPFAVFHARQSLALAIATIATPLVWAALAWGLAWIPLAGAMLGVILFALVLAAYVGLACSWLLGMVYALRGTVRHIPLVGAISAPRRVSLPASPSESASELLERTTTIDA
jgi:uncharacterized membrane protein